MCGTQNKLKIQAKQEIECLEDRSVGNVPAMQSGGPEFSLQNQERNMFMVYVPRILSLDGEPKTDRSLGFQASQAGLAGKFPSHKTSCMTPEGQQTELISVIHTHTKPHKY